ncbi:C4-dicarboxylate ABC transporter [Acinetobacter chinensis]|jgi:C4-dicarboxylate transporter/malic acid transport protein|uniref:C4-dicarboxylate ABC transporter n=1 Tax=Acinetobacter chinensis TaxID=2004650 RepID=A0A3B7LXW1_9GAMM|nr:TDT family transporter [Acinetobacter chinensis]AXY55289.1 C4-dicarboxylate ABC transporter [Acinetobacter chinensis]WOE41638.1 TDT family transporter [Acinetobacter chinensis]
MQKPFYQLHHPREVIRQFTPNWFTVTMGTGVVALILPEFLFAHELLLRIATLLWQINTVLFSVFSILYLLRWLIYPHEARQIFSHSSMALFLGTIPMGLATVLNGFLKFGLPLYGDVAVQIAQVLWYTDVVLAVAIGIIVPFCMFNHQQHELQTMTAMWLLPIVACEVAATSGGLLVVHLPAGQEAVGILFAGYVLWGMSVLPAFAVLTILMLRLALHKLPGKELAISGWLALGPIGTGALALLVLGAQAPQVLAFIQMQQLGVFFQQAGIVASFILLGFGIWWFAIAVLTTLKHAVNELPFNLGWWGLTFPLGVFTLAVLNLGHQLKLEFIVDTGLGFAAILMLLWVMVMAKTVRGMYQGHLFFSPCLKSLLEREQKGL